MGLKTRLDGRSNENCSIKIKDVDGLTLAEVVLLDNQGVTFEVETAEGCYIEKPSGWNSKPKPRRLS